MTRRAAYPVACAAALPLGGHGAAKVTGEKLLSPRLLLALARNPRWLAGVALGALSFAIDPANHH